MTSSRDPGPPWPETVTTPADLQRLRAAARVHHTPCGDGTLVWHAWGTGDPVLLLHGGAGSWTHWVRNIGALVRAGRSVWAPDMPGFGDSARAPGCDDADRMPPWLAQGLQALLGPRAVDAAGFSFGGLVGAYLAVQHPGQVASLMLVGAPALSEERRAPLPMRAWSAVPEGPRRDAIHRHNLLTLMIADPAAVDDLAVAVHAANVERDRMRRRRLMLTDALRRLLPQIRCPLAGIWGEQDVLYRDRPGLVARALALAADYRGLTMLPGAGHWAPYEAAAAFDAALVTWLQALRSGAGRLR